jgi:hypothetical protein
MRREDEIYLSCGLIARVGEFPCKAYLKYNPGKLAGTKKPLNQSDCKRNCDHAIET